MVNNWMTPAAFVNMSNAEGTRPLQGCIPDLLARQPPPGGGATQEALCDLKIINQCKTRYPPNQNERCGPVKQREAEIPTEYANRLRSKDQRYHHTQPGQKGPMEAALQSYGGCKGLIGGFYGEMSPNFDRLVKAAAEKGADRAPREQVRPRGHRDGRWRHPVGTRQQDPHELGNGTRTRERARQTRKHPLGARRGLRGRAI